MPRQSSPPHPGLAIQERREAIGLSREGLAYMAGVSLSTIERLEAEKHAPRRATLSVIDAALADGEKAAA